MMNRERRSFWQWYKAQRIFAQIGLGCASIVAILLLCFVVLVAYDIAHPPASTQQAPTPTRAATHAATQYTAVTHGTPQIGGPISDFYGKYGQPHNQDASGGETWIADQQVSISADPDTHGSVTQVTVVGLPAWSNAQTQAYCMRFLPAGATAFNTVGDLTDYHSRRGEIVQQLPGQGSCVLSLVQQ